MQYQILLDYSRSVEQNKRITAAFGQQLRIKNLWWAQGCVEQQDCLLNLATDNWRVTSIFLNRRLLHITYAVCGFLTTYMALIVIPTKTTGLSERVCRVQVRFPR